MKLFVYERGPWGCAYFLVCLQMGLRKFFNGESGVIAAIRDIAGLVRRSVEPLLPGRFKIKIIAA
jgi:hypothetical protein